MIRRSRLAAASLLGMTTSRVGDLLSDTVGNGLAAGRSVVHLFQSSGEHVTALAGDVLAGPGNETPPGRPAPHVSA